MWNRYVRLRLSHCQYNLHDLYPIYYHQIPLFESLMDEDLETDERFWEISNRVKSKESK